MRSSLEKVVDLSELTKRLVLWRQSNDQVVFTNGCFDLLHLGHVRYLEEARRLGNRLIVGINSDHSVRHLKGPGRPVMDENSRSSVIACMQFVDAVIIFDEISPERLIEHILPDVLVKGKDYNLDNIVGSDIVMEKGGKVVTIELISGYSTTAIIDKIKKL